MKSAAVALSAELSGEQTNGACTFEDARLSAEELSDRIAELIGRDLRRVNQIVAGQLRNPHELMNEVLGHVGRFRGKQIRPVLLLLCHTALKQEVSPTAHTLAAVVEMIHTATLVHDDVLDDADLRRHDDTVHRRWNSETSILLGDYLFSRAFRLAASTGEASACELIGRATDLTCAGELHQMEARLQNSRSETDYFRVIRGKTGQLFGLSCLLGARCAGASDSLQRVLRLGGIEAGIAFQIADDLLDLTGHENQTGKDFANDLANHRMTLPILRTLRLASDEESSELFDHLRGSTHHGSRNGTPSAEWKLLRSHPAVRRGLHSAQQTAHDFIDRAVQRFAQLPPSMERDLLQAIARFAVHRSE